MQMSSGDPSITCNTQVITLETFKKFLESRQIESKNDVEIKIIIEVSCDAHIKLNSKLPNFFRLTKNSESAGCYDGR